MNTGTATEQCDVSVHREGDRAVKALSFISTETKRDAGSGSWLPDDFSKPEFEARIDWSTGVVPECGEDPPRTILVSA